MEKKRHSIEPRSKKLTHSHIRSKKETLKLWNLLKKCWFNSILITLPKAKKNKKNSYIQKKNLWFMLRTKSTNIQLLYKIKKKIGYGRIIILKKNNNLSTFKRISPLTSFSPGSRCLKGNSLFEEKGHEESLKNTEYCYYIITSRVGLLRCIHIYERLLNKQNEANFKHNIFKTELKRSFFLKRFIKWVASYNEVYKTNYTLFLSC